MPNAWDAATARLIEDAGAVAVGTTSAGIAWAHGRSDGQGLSRAEIVSAVSAIARVVDIPVTADVERGYGRGTVDDVVETVTAMVEAGVIGINLEDGPGDDGAPLLWPEEQAERIHAAREAAIAAGGDLVINARTDPYIREVGTPEERFEQTTLRARVYLEAGADCVFVPGVIDATTISALVREIDGPLNVMAMAGAPEIRELGALGVARVSVGPAITLAALATAREAARELLEEGTYGTLAKSLTFAEIDGGFARMLA